MNPEDRIWLLISRAIAGDLSPAELQEMEQHFLLYPELRIIHGNLHRLRVNVPAFHSVEERRAMERGLVRFDNLILKEGTYAENLMFEHSTIQPLRRNQRRNWMVAASIISLLIIGALSFQYKVGLNPLKQQELSTLYGKRNHTILPDGSKVWLNAGSSINYTSGIFGSGKREVTLVGEAYFDVKHDSAHPFVVHAGKLNIAVLGTAFNVKAYANENFAETTLIRGKVSLSVDGISGSALVLHPNEKATIRTDNFVVLKTLVSNRKVEIDSLSKSKQTVTDLPSVPEDVTETAWIANKLSFKKESFANLAKQLERWYDVTIVFNNEKYVNKEFTGAFKGQDIDEVMRALQLIQPFNYKKTNNQIHIW
ncbi:transmembrane sensor [Pedobacter sp. UYEF25]